MNLIETNNALIEFYKSNPKIDLMVPVEQPLQLLLVLLKMYGTDLYGLRVQFQQYINMLFWMPTTIRLPMAISTLVK